MRDTPYMPAKAVQGGDRSYIRPSPSQSQIFDRSRSNSL